MTDLVGGVEPERQEWAAGQLGRVTCCGGKHVTDCRWTGTEWQSLNRGRYALSVMPSGVVSVEPLVAVPAGFGERLAQAIEGLRVPGNLPMAQAWDMRERAAALVREQFTQLAGHDRNKT